MSCAYLDTSVLLRFLLRQPGHLKSWGEWETMYASELTRVEFLRSLDRMRLLGDLDDEEYATIAVQFALVWSHVGVVNLSPAVLDRAAQSFPTVLGTLDALHLSTALHVQAALGKRLILLTHDRQLSTAARALNLPTRGV